MNAAKALQEMKSGAVVTDEMYQEYRILDEDEKIFFGDGEDIYRSRKSTGEFISIDDFLTSNQNFELVKDQ